MTSQAQTVDPLVTPELMATTQPFTRQVRWRDM